MPSNACLHCLVYTSLCTSSRNYSLSFTENLDPLLTSFLSIIGHCPGWSQHPHVWTANTLFPPFLLSPHLHLLFLSAPVASGHTLHPSEISRKSYIFTPFITQSPTTKSRNRTLLPQKPPLAPYPEITTIPTSDTRAFVDPFVRLRKFPSISICITNVYNFIGFLYEMIIIVFLLYLLICGLYG